MCALTSSVFWQLVTSIAQETPLARVDVSFVHFVLVQMMGGAPAGMAFVTCIRCHFRVCYLAYPCCQLFIAFCSGSRESSWNVSGRFLESLCLVFGPCDLSWWVPVGLNEQSFPHALYKHAYRVGCFGTVRGFFGHDSDTLCISLVYPTLMMFLLVSKRGSLDRYGSLSRLLWCIAGRLQLRACSTRFWNCFDFYLEASHP